MFFDMIQDNDDQLMIERLYERHRTAMYYAACDVLKDPFAAEDAVHQAFICVMKNLHKIDESNTARTRGYLVMISRNTAIDMYNQRLPLNAGEELPDAEMYVDPVSAPDEILISKETLETVSRIIEEMDTKYRDPLFFKRVHKMSVDEIADMMGISAEAVKKRLQRAKKMIQEKLEKEASWDE